MEAASAQPAPGSVSGQPRDPLGLAGPPALVLVVASQGLVAATLALAGAQLVLAEALVPLSGSRHSPLPGPRTRDYPHHRL